MKYLLLVQYDGTHFSGYQRQREERTVQSVLEEAAERVFGAPTRVIASGRTDAGVHAAGQICELEGETAIPPEKLYASLNSHLPPDCKVLASTSAPDGFDVTRETKRKTYVYTAYFAPCALPLLSRYAARLTERPSLSRMGVAAELLEGEHDFAAFRASGFTSKTSVRTLYSVEVERVKKLNAEIYTITVTGNGFLYNMVRILAGELFAVGCGKETKDLLRAFETGDRALLAKTMPAAGLCLKEVDYGIPLFGNK